MRVYRIRKQVTDHGKLKTYHADVLAKASADALEAARWGRVENWRIVIEVAAPMGVTATRYSYVTLVESWDYRDPKRPRAA